MNVELEKNREPWVMVIAGAGLPAIFFFVGRPFGFRLLFLFLLVLFQMVPLPMGVLKVVSPATYELYEEMLPEVGGRLATDPHRLTQPFVRQTPDKQATRLTGQASPDKNGHRFAKRQKAEGREKDEHRTSNTRLPCITNDGGMIIVTGPTRSAGACAAWTQGIFYQDYSKALRAGRTSNIE
ncbi:MAG: hypothetical protein U9R02_09415 [Thermodesulfobacteriota bacterium]|nr:hypothetical protein [Thermodesulfobacteriota bacterium]